MLLSIITINRNNASGLQRTMNSVLQQNSDSYEYIVVDGASTDGSVSVIEQIASDFGAKLKWISEPDAGIYNAMNKGLGMAAGEYVQFLNSGDVLASTEVVGIMFSDHAADVCPPIIYGNMIKAFPDGHTVQDKSFEGRVMTCFDFYSGTLNHSSAFIRRDLFGKYGLYDESLKICSDWEWFLDAVVFGGEKPEYVDFDVTCFDMTGISENKSLKELIRRERQSVLEKRLSPAVLNDYSMYAEDIRMMRRIHRHKWAYSTVRFIERILFKLEKQC